MVSLDRGMYKEGLSYSGVLCHTNDLKLYDHVEPLQAQCNDQRDICHRSSMDLTNPQIDHDFPLELVEEIFH